MKKTISALSSTQPALHPQLIEDTLTELMALPTIFDRTPVDKTDLAIDLTVSDYNDGEILPAVLGYPVPLAWRPEVVLTARVFEIDSGETVFAHTVKHRLEWGIWQRKLRSPQALLGLRPFMSPDDVQNFVRRACVILLKRVQKKI